MRNYLHVVVDGLFNGLSVLEGGDLLVHEVEVVLKGIKGGKSRNLTSVTVVKVEVIKTDDGGKVGDKSVGFPSSLSSESTSEGSDYSSKQRFDFFRNFQSFLGTKSHVLFNKHYVGELTFFSSESRGETPHEGRFSTSGIGSNSNNNGLCFVVRMHKFW